MLHPHGEAALALLRRAPVIPVLTVRSVEDAAAQARALIAGGLTVLEITLRTPAALAAVTVLAKQFPNAVIGAGTIVEAAQIKTAASAGAAFLVSPGMTPFLAEAAVNSPVPFLPGAATASEAMALRERGFRALKFFPAEAAGGVRYLASLAGPLPDLIFCPTGGIGAQKAKDYLALANVACVGGSWMVAPEIIAAQDFAKAEELAREASALRRRL
ncbi:MAG: bifunctional 4-hydroxy-2-oxoglutarate aldolase/2-dehydro-3-deoxy-phosphogluconate aldolase [Beijerinckiaceae bacterium]|nr:bifunctional 4-hydroxy-2-oxoglutarate aldolase/2-dehydro-3-deoxy-phosphogluconate aldolase [Beijerinckiaceae bacterium]